MARRLLIALLATGMTAAIPSAYGEQAETLLDQARIDRKAAAALRERGDLDSARAAAELERRAAEVERRAESLRSLGGAADAMPADVAAPAADMGQPAKKAGTDVSVRNPFVQSEAARRRAAAAALAPEQRSKARALSAQGKALLQQNEILAAKIRLQGALDIDPANAEAHLYLGELYRGEGRRTKAEEHYALAKDLDPDSTEAAIAMARLQTLRAGTATAAVESLLNKETQQRTGETAGTSTSLVSLLGGTWCWDEGEVRGTSVINGSSVRITARAFLFGGTNEGTVRTLNERQFEFVLPNAVDTYEMVDQNSFRWLYRNGRSAPHQGSIHKRCEG